MPTGCCGGPAEKGFLVLLTPAYVGSAAEPKAGTARWSRTEPSALRRYGEYLGRRYRDFGNILWVQAGDYNPPGKDLVRAIVEGIRESDPRRPAHGARRAGDGRDRVLATVSRGCRSTTSTPTGRLRRRRWGSTPRRSTCRSS